MVHWDEQLESFVEAAEPVAVADAAPAPVQAHRDLAKTPADVAQAAAKMIFSRVDHESFGSRRLNGEKTQNSRNRLNRWFGAKYAKWVYGKPLPRGARPELLSKQKIAEAVRSSRDLYFRGSWLDKDQDGKWPDDIAGYVLVRLESDAHKGEIDARQLVEWLNIEFKLNGFVCDSDQGSAVYFWLAVPVGDRVVGYSRAGVPVVKRIPLFKKAGINAHLDRIRAGIEFVARDRGFEAKAECQGEFLRKTQPKDEHDLPTGPAVIEGPMRDAAKLPRFQTMADVEQLQNAIITPAHEGFQRLVQLCDIAAARATAIKRLNEKAERVERLGEDFLSEVLGDGALDYDNEQQLDRILAAAAPKPGKQKPVTRSIEKTGDWCRDKFNCAVRAFQLLGARSRAERETVASEAADLAGDLYIENHLGDSYVDGKRMNDIATAVRAAIRRTDDSLIGHGTGGTWFNHKHVQQVAHRIMSTPECSREVEKFNNSPLAKHGKLSQEVLGVVACTMAKNATVGVGGKPSEGDCPTRAVARMLAHEQFNLPHGGSLIAAAMKIVLLSGAMVQTAAAVWKGVRAAANRAGRYVVNKLAWFKFLPQPVEAPRAAAATTTTGPKTSSIPSAILPSSEYRVERMVLKSCDSRYSGADLVVFEADPAQTAEFCTC